MIDLEAITVAELERDPYPIYARLRAEAPVAHVPALDVWMVTRWDDVQAAMTDPDRFPAHVEDSPTDRALGGVSMMTTDGEPAKSRRRPFDVVFRPRAVERDMPDVFARLCDEQLEVMSRTGDADLVTDYFEPISMLALAHAIGIADLVDVADLQRWFRGLAAGVSNYENDADKWARCQSISDEIDEVLRPRFEALDVAPDGGMLSGLLTATQGTLDERIGWAMPSLKLVLLGGLQEPAHGGATIAYCLLADPEQMALLRGDLDLAGPAVEEGLRWTAPIGNLLRSVRGEIELGGVTIPEDARVILVVSSANRDRSIWGPTADRFDMTRERRTHASFAAGPHYCIGHHFARVQLRTAITKLVRRFPGLELDPSATPRFWGHEYRSPTSLRVRLA